MGGGTQTGTFALTTTDSHLLFSDGHTVTDNGATFTGDGFVHYDGGTINAPGGVYTPNYNLAFVGAAPALPGVTGLSIGMSGDFKAAVMLGATVVRVGTALF